MSKQKKNKLEPKLRFKEFTKVSDWIEVELNQLGKTLNGLTGKSAQDFGIGNPFVTYVQVFRNSVIDFEMCGKVLILENEKQNRLQRGDILFTSSSETPEEVGFASVVVDTPPKDTYLNSFCFLFRPFSLNVLDLHFSRYLFHSPLYRNLISNLAQGITRYNISKSIFLALKLFVPKSINEQQKIANCLSSLDDLISAEAQKLEALRLHKKGLMQRLFPKEGERVPELRFEGRNEWEEMLLGNLGKFTGGGTPSKNRNDYWLGDIPWVSSSDIDEEFITKIQISRFITEEGLKDSATKLVPANSILLVSRVGVGKLAVTKASICTSQDFTNFTPNEVNLFFLAYYLKSITTKLLSFSQGMAIKGFTKEDISKLVIPLPQKAEQNKIAECLTSLDSLIDCQSEKVESLRHHKQGLLQQLFPSPLS